MAVISLVLAHLSHLEAQQPVIACICVVTAMFVSTAQDREAKGWARDTIPEFPILHKETLPLAKHKLSIVDDQGLMVCCTTVMLALAW